MKRAKLILAGAAALVIGSTAAQASTTMYEVDEDRDGRPERTLILEQSDSLA